MDMDDNVELTYNKKNKQRRIRCIAVIVVVILVFVVGFLIGYFAQKSRSNDQDKKINRVLKTKSKDDDEKHHRILKPTYKAPNETHDCVLKPTSKAPNETHDCKERDMKAELQKRHEEIMNFHKKFQSTVAEEHLENNLK